ncbi:hypothetical protein TNCV_3855061 [Trichonephila clavipes]|nr:hypothetical protein TNCV_3855061 [Trichonephila clavipes]
MKTRPFVDGDTPECYCLLYALGNSPKTAHEHWFQSAFRRDSSAKPRADESHLVRDQDCIADGIGTPDQELQYGFALPSPSVVSHCHPTTERQFEKPRTFFPNRLFQLRQGVTVPSSIDDSNLQKVKAK